MSQYISILKVTLTLLMLLWKAPDRDFPVRFIKVVVNAIVGLGIVFHALLARLVTLVGIDLWVCVVIDLFKVGFLSDTVTHSRSALRLLNRLPQRARMDLRAGCCHLKLASFPSAATGIVTNSSLNFE